MVYDKTTNFYWQQSGSPRELNYAQAEEYVHELNSKKFGGYSDWRLPTLEEAMSLMEPTRKNGNFYIDPVFDKTQRWIWTSSKPSVGVAWFVDFIVGDCSIHLVDTSYRVRAVRTGQLSI